MTTNTLVKALNKSPAIAQTENGAATNQTTLKKTLDFFFLAGASRGKDITQVFNAALAEDAKLAARILLWTRDAREGAGERQTFRDLLEFLATKDSRLAARLLKCVPELGRWDDVVHFVENEHLGDLACKLIAQGLKAKNGLTAKWAPRKGAAARLLREHLHLSPKQYRKLIVELSNTVEQLMCAQKWKAIEYEKVPSVAAARYQAAFALHDPTGYKRYRDSLVKGTTKINASAIFPYDVIKGVKHGDSTVANQQWKALPNFMAGSKERILPVVDVSGSMEMANVSPGTTALDVAISLGLYISERNEGPFKDFFMTFSGTPELQHLKGTLAQRYDQLLRSHWGMNTDIEAVFDIILSSATGNRVKPDDMPTKILIISDMEFDCVRGGRSLTIYEDIKRKYAEAGYTLPTIIFWNLNGRVGNMPVTFDQNGTALISGFSPSILTSVMAGENVDPVQIMLKTVMSDRYAY